MGSVKAGMQSTATMMGSRRFMAPQITVNLIEAQYSNVNEENPEVIQQLLAPPWIILDPPETSLGPPERSQR
jgi:hypothetical protein